MSVRQTRLAGYTWTPEQKADYEEIYQGWDASDMAAEIVNREILHQSSLAEREQRIATLRGTVKSHIADLKGMENIFREHGSFKETADEILVAISELEAALAATEGEKRETK